MSSQQATRARAVRVARVIRASPHRVFDAWTDPDQVCQWFGRPPIPGRRVSRAAIDLREGGEYRIEMGWRERTMIAVVGVFEVVAAPHHLQYTFCWERSGQRTSPTRVRVEFSAHPDGTEVTVVHTALDSRRSRAFHGYGWVNGLARLRRILG